MSGCGSKKKSRQADNEPGDTLPDLEDVAAVAAFLCTTKKAVYSMVARGQLPQPIRVGKRMLFVRADLVRWFEEKRAASPGGNWR